MRSLDRIFIQQIFKEPRGNSTSRRIPALSGSGFRVYFIWNRRFCQRRSFRFRKLRTMCRRIRENARSGTYMRAVCLDAANSRRVPLSSADPGKQSYDRMQFLS